MIGDLFLALALGQTPMPMPPVTAPPVPTPPKTTPAVPSVPAPAVSGPLTSSTGEKLVPNGDGTYRVDGSSTNGNGSGDAEKKADEPAAEDPPATKYLVEKLLDGSRAGQLLSDRGIKIYGWAAMNYTAGSSSVTNLPTTFNERDDHFQLNQNYLVFEKGLDTEKKEFQYGFQTDLILPGTDARYTISRGLLESQLRNGRDGLARNYPIDLFQAYGQFYLPNVGQGTTVKVGKFATHLGYELVQAPLTPFVSRSYLFQYNPFTHTGVYATTQLNDDWSMSNGVALGNDNFIDPTNRATYLGQLKWAPKDGDLSVQLGVSATNPKYDTAEAFPIYNAYNLLITKKFNDKFTYVADMWFSHGDNFPGAAIADTTQAGADSPRFGGPRSANWFGVANYLIYQHCEKLTSTLRIELFNDSMGVRTGQEGLYTAVTYGIAYTPIPATIFRPFVRYDHNRNAPFEGERNLVTAGLEAIFRY